MKHHISLGPVFPPFARPQLTHRQIAFDHRSIQSYSSQLQVNQDLTE